MNLIERGTFELNICSPCDYFEKAIAPALILFSGVYVGYDPLLASVAKPVFSGSVSCNDEFLSSPGRLVTGLAKNRRPFP